MQQTIPRIVLAGTGSGCGKTTVSCAVMQALINRNKKVGACKCGPDYIDPMFHSRIIGAKSSNLDLFFCGDNTVRYLLAEHSADRDITVIEGVMGYYDGMGLTSAKSGTYDLARTTDSPTVLVVNARGASLSVLAVICGFLDFCQDHTIRGVILNECSAMTYPALAKEIEMRFHGKVRPLGYLPRMTDCMLESRHLGLVTAAEVAHLQEKMQALASQAEKTLDLDGLIALAESAPDVTYEQVILPRFSESVRIAVAKDKAFCFYYEDSLHALEKMGAELVEFSPLTDACLPEHIHGLYLGGGYPELYADKLSQNESMRNAIRTALLQELPCIAECGGFMYLTERIGEHPMVGFLPGICFDTGKLTRFGYVTLQANVDSMLCSAGETIAAHEFHHWDCTETGADFTAAKANGRSWACVKTSAQLYAGFPHFHFYANPRFAVRFYNACLKEKNKHD